MLLAPSPPKPLAPTRKQSFRGTDRLKGRPTRPPAHVDHLAIAGESLASIRERFNVVPLAHPMVADPT